MTDFTDLSRLRDGFEKQHGKLLNVANHAQSLVNALTFDDLSALTQEQIESYLLTVEALESAGYKVNHHG